MASMHELKISPEYFNQQDIGTKTFELRFDDRGFEVGDLLLLREYDRLTYTGRQVVRKVVGLLRGPVLGLAAGWVILSTAAEKAESPAP